MLSRHTLPGAQRLLSSPKSLKIYKLHSHLKPNVLTFRHSLSNSAIAASEPVFEESDLDPRIANIDGDGLLDSHEKGQKTNATRFSPPDAKDNVQTLLPLLVAQKPQYATMHIHARPYLITEGDTVRLPFRMPDVQPGDILRLTCMSSIGSRDYTLRGSPYIDQNAYECRAVVAGMEAEPMRFKEKTMRRNRRVKTVKSKQRFTELTIKELTVNYGAQFEKVTQSKCIPATPA